MGKGILYTIGYSGFYDTADFIAALKKYNIDVLIDVRSMPFSRGFEQYNRNNVEPLLKEKGIYYRNYANEFGARQKERAFYRDGRLDFAVFAASEQFQEGVRKIEKSVRQNYTVCFMCAEKEPIDCHRAILVSKAFYDIGYQIIHIMPGDKTKTQDDLNLELINSLNFFDQMSCDEKDYLALAYKKQNDKIGFKESDL